MAVLLADELQLTFTGDGALAPRSWLDLRAWMHDNLTVAVFPLADGAPVRDLHGAVRDALDPPLNIDRRRTTPLREMIKLLRAEVGRRSG